MTGFGQVPMGVTNEFSLTAENGNLLTLNTAGNHISLMPDGGGFVGIGTLAPAHPLNVTKTYTNNWQARFTNGASNVYLAHQGGYGMHINTGNTDVAKYAITSV